MSIEAYPLSWPIGWPRTAPSKRTNGRFRSGNNWVTTADAVGRVLSELRRFGVARESIIISTNIESKSDGTPRNDRSVALVDPGAGVYWTDPETKQQQCIAIDQYTWVSDNLAAIAATLDAMRAIERHGGAQILKRAFEGFKALPAAGQSTPTMDLNTAATVISNYHPTITPHEVMRETTLARQAVRSAKAKSHPDVNGGDHSRWDIVETARKVLEAHHGGAL